MNVFFIFVVFNCLLHLLFYMDVLRNIEFQLRHAIWMYLEKSFDVVYVIISKKALFVDMNHMISQKVVVHKFNCSKKSTSY